MCSPALTSRAMKRFSRLMQVEIRNPIDVVHLTLRGVPIITVRHLIDAGIPEQDLLRFVPQSALNQQQSPQLLTSKASDRLIRFVKVQALAIEVLGDVTKATRWLHRPRRMFDGLSAIDAMQSDMGAQLVAEALGQLDEGYVL